MKRKSFVFDIQRSSLHDGPGIRTTIFLKGCPLRCLWCHNPEAASFERQLFFYQDRCQSCGACVPACPQSVHHVKDGLHTIDYPACDFCGDCIAVCNQRALKIVGIEKGIDEVMREILADRDFYAASGGGMTLSGGEPLSHMAFSMELLTRSKALGIHTCVETCGYVPATRIKKALPVVDYWLFDYKMTGSALHQKYTGVPNDLILANLELVYRTGAALVLRCPIIPGINDTPDHFEGIRSLDLKYPDLKGIEILPYHDMGNSKRTSIGQEISLPGVRTPESIVRDQWVDQLRSLGCEKARIG